MLRSVLAPNASPLTLDGTRTYVVGERTAAVIDPGPNRAEHLDALVALLGPDAEAVVLVTHHHPDHMAGAGPLAARLGAPVRRLGDGSLRDGDRIRTDAGDLVAIATPGHTRDHLAFHWPERAAVFCGDLMMGGQDTTLVAAPEGRLGPYLASLARVRDLEPAVLYPTHGPPIEGTAEALDAYVQHRRDRLERVRSGIESGIGDYDGLLRFVYGDDLDPELARPAMTALKAYIEHLHARGEIRRLGRNWQIAD